MIKPTLCDVYTVSSLFVNNIGSGISEAKLGVNKPELLPKEFTPVIDVAGFLSDGQVILISSIPEQRPTLYTFVLSFMLLDAKVA